MTSTVGAAVRRVAASWTEEVRRRRQVSGLDPVADALDYCAAEIVAAVKDAEAAECWGTVREYAARTGRTAATVRRWCRQGKLGAEQLPDGDYRIPIRALPPLSQAG